MQYRYLAVVSFCAGLASAVDIHAQALPQCDTGTPTLALCEYIPQNTCCVFPTGGAKVQGVYFSLLSDCSSGTWYSRTQDQSGCVNPRLTRFGYEQWACLTNGGSTNGGGARWLSTGSCPKKRSSGRVDSRSEANAITAAEAVPCASTTKATVVAFEGNGAWVLEPQSPNWEVYNSLPEYTDMGEHLANLQKLGTWYADYNEHSAAAAAMRK